MWKQIEYDMRIDAIRLSARGRWYLEHYVPVRIDRSTVKLVRRREEKICRMESNSPDEKICRMESNSPDEKICRLESNSPDDEKICRMESNSPDEKICRMEANSPDLNE